MKSPMDTRDFTPVRSAICLFYFQFLTAVILSSFGHAAFAASASRPHDLTYDLGVSSGNYGSVSYTEFNFGLNWFAQDWLAWRNSIFARTQPDVPTAFGIDSSLRLVGDFGSNRAGLTAFVGPGYRFASGTPTAPFAEEGLVFHVAGLALGAGAKQIFDSWIHQGAGNDNQLFIILGGGGSL